MTNEGRARRRASLIKEVEELREATWRDTSIKTGSPEWNAIVKRCESMRRKIAALR